MTTAAIAALAGCTMNDSTTTFPTTTLTAAEPATTPPPGSGEPAPACPLGAGCPREDITPGAVIPSTAGICQRGFNDRKELPAATKRLLLVKYGFATTVKEAETVKVAEWDHRIARWAGGTSTSSNVFPQVDESQKRRKDRLEYGLYLKVCRDHTMPLEEARARMLAFWAWF